MMWWKLSKMRWESEPPGAFIRDWMGIWAELKKKKQMEHIPNRCLQNVEYRYWRNKIDFWFNTDGNGYILQKIIYAKSLPYQNLKFTETKVEKYQVLE